jgi:hypothetical protein
MKEKIPFLPGRSVVDHGLLTRFLPPIPDGIAASWLSDRFPPGSLIFDPFGAAPNLAIETARSGYKVLTCVNNPVIRLLLTMKAVSPSEQDYRKALAELARTRVGDERLEIHIRNLYQTRCNQCGQDVIAEAFIWERDAHAPRMKIYNCKNCGESGEHLVSDQDIDLAQSFSTNMMHRLRIIERITSPEEIERQNVSEALPVYLPRAIYALVSLINQFEVLTTASHISEEVDPGRRLCLLGLILSALDQANNLWSFPSGRTRPKQLTSSPQFRENNVWLALENAVARLVDDGKPVELTVFPELPERGGICIYEGPLRHLRDELMEKSTHKKLDIKGSLFAVPRHNQAFWTLSALWAGWILGRESIRDYKSVLHRRRYDWSWHCAALNSAFNSVKKILNNKIPMLGIIVEAESSFIHSAVIAASRANISLNGISLRVDTQHAQIHWALNMHSPYQITAPFIQNQLPELIAKQGVETLRQRGEPAPYISMQTAALTFITTNQKIDEVENQSAAAEYNRIQNLIENAFSYKNGYVRHGGSEKSLENATLWHQKIDQPGMMLSDRVESKVYQILTENKGHHYHEIDRLICENFPGMQTPDSYLIKHCLESYCNKEGLETGKITLRDQDQPGKRRIEISSTILSLHDLGDRLGFSSRGDNPIIWDDTQGQIGYIFHVTASAELGKIVIESPFPAGKSFIVIPGARANLILYKLKHNFFLEQVVNQGWRFLKFRHLRHLLDSPTITLENIDQELALDPMTESPAQMRLF